MTTRRYGPRYGKRVKDQLRKIEIISKKLHVCPRCRKQKAKRVAMGIFECKKCGNKFTGKAYSVQKKKRINSSQQLEDIDEDIIIEEEMPNSIDENSDKTDEKTKKDTYNDKIIEETNATEETENVDENDEDSDEEIKFNDNSEEEVEDDIDEDSLNEDKSEDEISDNDDEEQEQDYNKTKEGVNEE